LIILNTILIITCGFLGGWAGAEGTSKNWRRIGIPVIIALAKWNWWGLLSAAPLRLGYGIPDGPPPLDQGSLIGRFFYYKVTKENPFWAAVCTRFVIGVLLGGTIAVVVRNIWPIPILGITMPLFGAVIKTEPQIKVFGKVLNTEEIIIYAIMGGCACL